ncbi:MAG: hypothetical protein PVG78_07365 [Desulfobacterales bacterium]|jgi:hypothetical protein
MKTESATEPSFCEMIRCPCCGRPTAVNLPEDYAPVYKYCGGCAEKFIVERLAEGFQVVSLGKCPKAGIPTTAKWESRPAVK